MSLADRFRQTGSRLSDYTERWVPDAWVICIMLTAVALVLAVVGTGTTPERAVLAWGEGIWKLLSLGMQFTISMVAAYACVASRPAYRFFDWLAGRPNPARPVQAVLLAGAFSMIAGYINWALCIVACALFTPFLIKRNPQADVRVLIAASYLGLGTIWHGGLSGSALLIMATPNNPLIAPAAGAKPVVDRLYPIQDTLFCSFNLVYVVVIFGIALVTVALLHPRGAARTVTPAQADALLPQPPPLDPPPQRPADRIDQFRGWTWLALILLVYPLGKSMLEKGFGQTWTIDAYNITFLSLALLLHGRPTSFLRACRASMDSAWGIIVQFPFYGGIFGLLQFTPLGHWLGEWFAQIATRDTFALVVYVYSGFMNLFIPSGGSKWLIEAPFLIPAGQSLGVSPVTTALAYAYGDSTTNLIQPFFALPILAITRLRFGEVVGYTFLIAVVLFVVNIGAMLLISPNL